MIKNGVAYRWSREYFITFDGLSAYWRPAPPNDDEEIKALFRKGDFTYITRYGNNEPMTFYNSRKRTEIKAVGYDRVDERNLL